MFEILKNAVGNNLENQEDDVRQIRNLFEKIDFLKEDEKETDYQGKPLGILTKNLDHTIKRFQRENNLREDGYIKPGGETELALVAKREKQPKKEKPPFVFMPERQENEETRIYNGIKINKDAFAQKVKERMILSAVEKDDVPTLEEKDESKNEGREPKRDEETLPLPEKKPQLLSKGNDDRVTRFIKDQEVEINHLYKDNKGYMTIGVGHLVADEGELKSLPLYLHDKNDDPIRSATNIEKVKIYQQTQSIKHGQNVVSKQYDPGKNSNIKNIRLRDQDVEALLKRDLRIKAQEL